MSGGCAEVLKLFTGDDYFGEEQMGAGHLTEPDIEGDTVILNCPPLQKLPILLVFRGYLGDITFRQIMWKALPSVGRWGRKSSGGTFRK